MYYLLNNDDEIIDVLGERPPAQNDVDRAAKMFGYYVWVLRGEHTGMSAEPPTTMQQSHENSGLDTKG
jgi:TusA-related sulfurtransferase